MKYIIFDFNGTILDDVDVGIKSINILIEKYLHRSQMTREEYLNIFDFPVKDYYAKVGFDFNQMSFQKIGREWVDYYESFKNEYTLIDGVEEILCDNLRKGYKNIILSASQVDNLTRQCQELGITQYFDDILGINDIYAGSKEGIARKWIADKNPQDCFLIGDTIHDAEVAKAINVHYALVAKGHQSKNRLEAYTKYVYDDIREVRYV